MAQQKEYKIVGTVTGLKGECGAGHKVGDKFELSCHNAAGLCGFMYHDIFPTIQMLQYGGSLPWGDNKDEVKVECPDRGNCLQMELRRVK